MSLVYNGKNIPLAKSLRKNATPEEKHLWYDKPPSTREGDHIVVEGV